MLSVKARETADTIFQLFGMTQILGLGTHLFVKVPLDQETAR